tara:strand:- start:54 stop:452 length:399 start_codon:yes stop_codon:yes gene_type:complete
MKKKNKKGSDYDIDMSVPEGMEFNTPYTMNNTKGHSKYYYDLDRNKGNHMTFAEKLDIEVQAITDLLKQKNKDYGNTALNPTNIFSKLNATEALCARIDDKLARIGNKGINDETEDTVDDLIGYLLLLKMSM